MKSEELCDETGASDESHSVVAAGFGLAFMLIYRGRSAHRVIRPDMPAWINWTIVSVPSLHINIGGTPSHDLPFVSTRSAA